jgi:lysyl-tRNA synthetase class 2
MSEREQDARRARLAELRANGVEPYPARTGPRTRIAELRGRHDAKDAEQLAGEANRAAIAGRVRARRSFGKLLFLDLVEDGAALQVSARKGETDAAAFAFLADVDVGDFVRVEGVLWRTKKGELTLGASAAELLA